MKYLRTYLSFLLLAALAVNIAGCGAAAQAASLMDGVSANTVSGKRADGLFINSMADFSVELFKKSIEDEKSSLISPLSVSLALAMVANGADGETLLQMEKLLGGDIPLAQLNEYLYSYANGLPDTSKSKFKIANSIWFRDNENRLQVEPDFLQKNADYYGAAAYASAFDSQTVNDINAWVRSSTDGMIDRILDSIDDSHMMFLINAVLFDAEWQTVYKKEDVIDGDFTDISGAVRTTEFMRSTESLYLDDGMATGFIKPYATYGYSFVALLPNEDVPIGAYIESLTGAGFIHALKQARSETIYASMPKFEYNYDILMNDALKALGIPDAFDEEKADFTPMAASPDGNMFINFVKHKAYIKVDELGTKAGAVTVVTAVTGSSAPVEPKTVRLDRPFLYAIIDNVTNLPLFIGTLMTVS